MDAVGAALAKGEITPVMPPTWTSNNLAMFTEVP
jgi:hypothetical protein